MRDFLNSILTFIGAASLTDEEFGSIDLSTQEYTHEVYLALKGVLASRESVSDDYKKIAYFFKAKGVAISKDERKREAQSNIFIGAGL